MFIITMKRFFYKLTKLKKYRPSYSILQVMLGWVHFKFFGSHMVNTDTSIGLSRPSIESKWYEK